MFGSHYQHLHKCLKLLPGIGDKTAHRLTQFLLTQEKEISLEFASAIESAVNIYSNCPICNQLTETNPCMVCADETRSNAQLCVVESSKDVLLLEQTKEFNGRYFVLGGLLSPIDGIGPEQLPLSMLMNMLEKFPIQEIILALNPSVEGETTILYLKEKLASFPLNITRLSTGIPFGGDMEYSSTITISNALKRRYSV